MENPAAELARRLAQSGEAVCRHYLSNGRRQGAYWTVGDVHNTKGRSLYVRLKGPGTVGKWTDAATLEHGDLLDLIRLNQGLATLREAMAEARAFLGAAYAPASRPASRGRPRGWSNTEAARRLFAAAGPIDGTRAEAYFRARGIWTTRFPALRYHARVYYRADDHAPLRRLPALLAAITDVDGRVVGVHRVWLDPREPRLASVPAPKRSLGPHLGHGVRFGCASCDLVAGEGVETVLSLKSACPELPMTAALSANHLAGLVLPPALDRLWIARDSGTTGRRASMRLRARAEAEDIAVRDLAPCFGDFNEDLRALGRAAFTVRVRHLLRPALVAAGVRERKDVLAGP